MSQGRRRSTGPTFLPSALATLWMLIPAVCAGQTADSVSVPPADLVGVEAHRKHQIEALNAGRDGTLLAEYRHLVESLPASATANYLFGRLLRSPTEALTYFERAQTCDPTLYWGHHGAGTALLELGQYERAAVALRRAVELDPDSAEAHLGLAQASLYTNQLDACRGHLAAAERLDPDLRGLEALRGRLDQLTAEQGEQAGDWRRIIGRAGVVILLLLAINGLILWNSRRKLIEATRSSPLARRSAARQARRSRRSPRH